MKVEVDILGFLSLNKSGRFCGRKTTLKRNRARKSSQDLWESRGGRPVLHVPNKPGGFCGRKATIEEEQSSGTV